MTEMPTCDARLFIGVALTDLATVLAIAELLHWDWVPQKNHSRRQLDAPASFKINAVEARRPTGSAGKPKRASDARDGCSVPFPSRQDTPSHAE